MIKKLWSKNSVKLSLVGVVILSGSLAIWQSGFWKSAPDENKKSVAKNTTTEKPPGDNPLTPIPGDAISVPPNMFQERNSPAIQELPSADPRTNPPSDPLHAPHQSEPVPIEDYIANQTGFQENGSDASASGGAFPAVPVGAGDPPASPTRVGITDDQQGFEPPAPPAMDTTSLPAGPPREFNGGDGSLETGSDTGPPPSPPSEFNPSSQFTPPAPADVPEEQGGGLKFSLEDSPADELTAVGAAAAATAAVVGQVADADSPAALPAETPNSTMGGTSKINDSGGAFDPIGPSPTNLPSPPTGLGVASDQDAPGGSFAEDPNARLGGVPTGNAGLGAPIPSGTAAGTIPTFDSAPGRSVAGNVPAGDGLGTNAGSPGVGSALPHGNLPLDNDSHFAAPGQSPHAGTPGLPPEATSVDATQPIPGPAILHGPQQPGLVIEKILPTEIQVQRPATFQLRVRNPGQRAVQNILVIDRVPDGTRFLSASPPAGQSQDTLMWQITQLDPGQEVILSVEVLPLREGEIGSVAQVVFQSQASAKTVCTQPKLEIKLEAPPQVLIGESAALRITVTNVGTGAAENVTVEEDVPVQFTHPAGQQLESTIGLLRPGETRRIDLMLTAQQAGVAENFLVVRAEGNIEISKHIPMQVVAPELRVGMSGPTIRYLERKASYTVEITNPGTAPAHDVDVVAHLPIGVQFVETDNAGRYDASTHAVHWQLQELPASEIGQVRLVTLPVQPGEHVFRIESKARRGLSDGCEHKVQVQGLSKLDFSITDTAGAIEQGSETTYTITVHNRGNKKDTNVRLGLAVSEGLELVDFTGPTQATREGGQVIFNPVTTINPGNEITFRVTVRGLLPGDHVLQARIASDDAGVSLTKEAFTRVYIDR